MKKRIKIVVALVLSGATICLFLYIWVNVDLGGFTPDSATMTTMHVVKRRILHYSREHDKLPESIDDLPILKDFNCLNTDYWGGKILIQHEGSMVSIISYGKDMKPGGIGSNLDLVASFDSKLPSGMWADENDDGNSSWKTRPSIRWDKSDFR